MNTTPVSLLEQLRRPTDEEAWARFVALYTPLLFYWARRVGLQEPDAADLVQDVFTQLVRKLPEFAYDRHKSFRSWLRTVTLNRWRTMQRRRAPQSLEGNPEALAALSGPDTAAQLWEAEYAQHLAARALAVMRERFEPATWQAFWACVAESRPAAEVAAQLGISVGAVYVARSRVLARLRQELDGLLD